MRTSLIYDLPTRIFHWIFAALFLIAFAVAKIGEDESAIFSYHMLAGLMLTGLVFWRIIWGIIGSTHSRFWNFRLNPIELKDYLLGMITGSKKKWSGHNPASSWAVIFMLLLGLGLGITGYLMTSQQSDALKELHEILANSFLVVVVMHIAGVIFHMFRHQDGIAFSMVDGRKQLHEVGSSISSSRRFSALILVVLVAFAGHQLYKNFDSSNQTLKLFGKTLKLSEIEENEGAESSGEQDNDDD